MRTVFYLLVLSLCIICPVPSDPYHWVHQFGTAEADRVFGLDADASGNLYLVGSTMGSLGSGGSHGDEDVTVARMTTGGRSVWTRQWGTDQAERANAVCVDGKGHIIVVGRTAGRLGKRHFGGLDCFVMKLDAEGELLWVLQFGSSGHDTVRAVASDRKGEIYLAGYTGGRIGEHASLGGTDMFVAKLSPDGKFEWTRQLGTSAPDRAHAVAIDRRGDILVCGETSGSFAPAEAAGFYIGKNREGKHTWVNQAAGVDLFAVKLNRHGKVLWKKQFGTEVTDRALGAALDEAGNLYIAGGTYLDHLSGQKYALFLNDGRSGLCDQFLVKYSTEGELEWGRVVGTLAFDTGLAVVHDGTGLYLAGISEGRKQHLDNQGFSDVVVSRINENSLVDWTWRCGTSGYDVVYGLTTGPDGTVYLAGHTDDAYPGEINRGSWDAYVLAVDETAANEEPFVFEPRLEQTSEASAVAVDKHGNVYTVGKHKNETTYPVASLPVSGHWRDLRKMTTKQKRKWPQYLGQRGGGIGDQVHQGKEDIVLIKYDRTGKRKWVRMLGSADDDYGFDVVVGPDGSIHISGHASGSLEGNPHRGKSDIFVAKYSPRGKRIWLKQMGTEFWDAAYCLDVDREGYVYVTGGTKGPLSRNPTEGEADLFLIKLDSSGRRRWIRTLGTTERDVGKDVKVDSQGNIYVAGFTNGSMDGKPNRGYSDALLMKFDSDGKQVWTRQLGSSKGEEAIEIALGGGGEVYIAGHTMGDMDGKGSRGGWDGFLARYSEKGDLIWVRQFGTKINDDFWGGLCLDRAGNLYFSGHSAWYRTWAEKDFGYTQEIIKNNPGVAKFVRQHPDLVNSSNMFGPDVYLVKYNAKGEMQWVLRLQREWHQYRLNVWDMFLDERGDLYLAGKILNSYWRDRNGLLYSLFVYKLPAEDLLQGRRGAERHMQVGQPYKGNRYERDILSSDFSSVDAHALRAPRAKERSFNSLAAYLEEGARDELEKARAVYRWITDRISYDSESYGKFQKNADPYILGPSSQPSKVLGKGTAVCSGYTYLFQELASRMGLDSLVVVGKPDPKRTDPSVVDWIEHAWNAVRIEDKWYLLDATWGAGGSYKKEAWTKTFKEQYFLLDPELLGHTPSCKGLYPLDISR